MRFHPVCDLFPAMNGDEFAALVEDIREHGVRIPVATHDGAIIDGRNRWKACKKLGIDCPTKEWNGKGSLVAFVVGLNLRRRHLTPSQSACVAAEMVPMLAKEVEAAAREKQREGGKKAGRGRPDSSGANVRHTSREPKSSEHAARTVGVSPRYVEEALRLKRDAPAKFEDVRSGRSTLSEAKQEIRQEKREALAAELAMAPLPEPTGKFAVVVVDPPWKYDSRAEDLTHRARNPYPDMTVPEIAALAVPARLDENAIVWLWTTNAFMRDAYSIADAWGLRVRTILTWAKDRMGTGDWLRGQTEHCLLCTRGTPIVTLGNQTTLLTGPLREHSRKPDEFFALVEALCPGPKLELFAREARPGWAAWGAEKERFAC